jgi:predicted CoA-binding protein
MVGSQIDSQLTRMFKDTQRIAVLGLSPDPAKASNGVALYLRDFYEIVPVNPNYDEILGLPCYPSVASIPEPVDMVDVFQRSERVIDFIDDTLASKVPFFWMQLGIRNRAARERLEAEGVQVVEDLCTKVEHARLLRQGALA